MTCLSGVACVFGALFICIDLLVRCLPRHKDFRIQDSNGFLSCSMSLSAGVMLFSALYTMLPNSKTALMQGQFSSRQASWILIALFLGGTLGIQILSRIAHHFMSHQTVDCDHEHDQEEHERKSSQSHDHTSVPEDTTPLLDRAETYETFRTALTERQQTIRSISGPIKPSLPSRVSTFVTGKDPKCDKNGACRGYAAPCGPDCFKKINSRGGTKVPLDRNWRLPTLKRSLSSSSRHDVVDMDMDEAYIADTIGRTSSDTIPNMPPPFRSASKSKQVQFRSSSPTSDTSSRHASQSSDLEASKSSHHHHVPKNAFLSISLQTSVAIALHKLPEGFITYATNHANPSLGLSVFVALAIHNLSEGFALALPIYLATNSRLRAILLSLILGGLTQPLGAGIAAIWLKLAEKDRGPGNHDEGSQAVYGGMFAITAGIMASVALSLLQESFELGHSKGRCMIFVFVGMGILGVSSALTA